ncbi:acyltransferase [Shewanella algicola]|uniref:Lysophospholipid acyltransferase family protein n=1 Tax=Shewanella algicola TaxID=640633 RepID=A0A9X2CCY6_9GAMM|nr:lysophospholipid acyltransferase family protein [Shewanella algicola]MCL1104652.1 lysophospholipid acyltransferase family protein [Shewanella algicola]GGP54416.1 acyltransferase [Shewanella algicola]
MLNTLCVRLLRLLGWTFEGQFDKAQPCVMIVGPHTSNWDFIIGIIARSALGTKIHFLGKHQLFIAPWGWLFRAMGGSPVDRRKHNNLVDAAAQLFQQDPNYKLALAPEGTRSPVTRWKSGFYHIAVKAQVDIVPVGLDFGRKTIVLSPPLAPTGNIEAEMNQLMDFYRTITGYRPKNIPVYQLQSPTERR